MQNKGQEATTTLLYEECIIREKEINDKCRSKEGKSPIHMGLILLMRTEWFAIIGVLDGGFNPQGIQHVSF